MNNSYSDKLIGIFFSCLQRKQDEEIYYDVESHDIVQHVQGYFSSLVTENQESENRILAQRIINREPTDSIIDGKHILIPRLSLSEFLNEFFNQSNNDNSIKQFIRTFENDVINELGMGVLFSDINNVTFSSEVANFFFSKLNEHYQNLNFNVEELKLIVNKTITSISLKYIESIK